LLKKNFSPDFVLCKFNVDKQDKERSQGVYAGFCLCSARAYIGESEDLIRRFDEHIALLRRKQHELGEMQRDWNLFGSDAFVFFPLEFVEDKLQRCARERAWIKKCLVQGKVYNQLNTVRKHHREAFTKCKPKWPNEAVGGTAKEYNFVTPMGDPMKVKGLRGICEAYGLNVSHMSKVARGIYVQHRGWTLGKDNKGDIEKLKI
jgi:group I intron endonuclease